jgi:hypothetical protein
MPTGKINTARNRRVASDSPSLRFEGQRIIMTLPDDRVISQPLQRYPSLLKASVAQRNAWELIGPAIGFHWPALDLDLSVDGLLHGLPERIPKPPSLESLKRHTPSSLKEHRLLRAGKK